MKTSIAASSKPFSARAALVVVTVGKPPGRLTGQLAEADAAVGGAIGRAVKNKEIRGGAGETTVFHASGRSGPSRIAVVGVGEGASRDDWESAGRAVAAAATKVRVTSATLVLPDDVDAGDAGALIEGAWLGSYRYSRFKTANDNGNGGGLGELAVSGGALDAKALAAIDTVMGHANATRDLSNTPANHLTPRQLADYARALARTTRGLTCTVLGPPQLTKLGAGALLAVGQGSAEPPQMIVLRYSPSRPRRGTVLGIVGKAVTFDTGGISIKPSAGMEDMKMDMTGGAIAIESIAMIAELGLPIETIAVIPAAENMPDGKAIKPGDVVTAMNGKTIEVVNTDAEGRMILADALTYAARNGATHIVDFATLTGAMVVALGDVYAGLFGSDEAWIDRVHDAATASGDRAWPMPLHEGYRPLIASDWADLSNASKKRQAGAVYAAMFLREFTEGVPWCHLDIAGTGMGSKGATGYGPRLMARLAEGLVAGKR
jgi:leucyl aminopeptidase